MSNEEMKRRDALGRLAKVLALAAGLGGAGGRRFLSGEAQSIATLTQTQSDMLLGVKALNREAKVLKALLFNHRDVFINEFGRLPGGLTTDPTGNAGCQFFFAVGGSSCDEQNCGGMGYCNDNHCVEQTCGKFNGGCGKNDCGNQHRAADFNPANCGVHNDIFSTAYLNGVLRDPFIQGLMKELKITTSAQLSKQLQTMLLVKRPAGLRRSIR